MQVGLSTSGSGKTGGIFRLAIDMPWVSRLFTDLGDLTFLAQGGQKWVFTAVHPIDGKVVIKLIKPLQDPNRVQREVETVRRMGSARVPKVFGTGAVPSPLGPLLWLREALVEGEPLRTVLARGRFNRPGLLRLAADLLEALDDAAHLGIVHRDVKPENILRDRDGRYWLLDFGVARNLDLESLTPTAAPWGVGTLGYSPPEQMRNMKAKIDQRSDLFSVGVVLYESGAGFNPFTAGATEASEVIRRIETVTPEQLPLDVSRDGDVNEFVQTLLQKYPDRRPKTIAEARRWLGEIEAVG
jgi:eukaryotic-like serine/threonine-protein kinase